MGSGGVAAHRTGAEQGTVREHDLEREGLIADAAVAATLVAEAVGAERAADRRDREGPRIVAEAEAVRRERGVDILQDSAGAGPDQPVRRLRLDGGQPHRVE